MRKVRVLVGGSCDLHDINNTGNFSKLLKAKLLKAKLLKAESYVECKSDTGQRIIPLWGGTYVYTDSIKIESELHEVFIWHPKC